MSDGERVEYLFEADASQAEAETKRMLQAFRELQRGASNADKELHEMHESFIGGADAAVIAIGAMATAIGVTAVSAFRSGLKEIEEGDQALRRLTAAADMTGQSFTELSSIAEKVSSDNLIEMDASMQRIADLTQRGFNTQQIDQMAVALKDIAAAAGGNVADNFEQLTSSILTGKAASAELQRLLPGLKAELQDLGGKASQAEKNQVLLNAVLEQGARVAGAAEEKVMTLAGQQQILATKIHDAQQAFAEELVPAINQAIKALSDATKGTISLSEIASIAGQTIGGTFRDSFNLVAQAVNGASIILSVAQRQWLEMANVANIVFMEMTKGAIAFLEGLKKLPGASDLVQGTIAKLTNVQGQLTLQSVQLRLEVAKEHQEFKALVTEGGRLRDEFGKLPPLLNQNTVGARNLAGGLLDFSESAQKATDETEKLNIKAKDMSFLFDFMKTPITLAKERAEEWAKAGFYAEGSAQNLLNNLDLLKPAFAGVGVNTEELTQFLIENEDQFKKTTVEITLFGKTLGELASILGSLGSQIGGVLGDLIGGAGAAISTFDNVFKETGSKAAAWAGGIETAATYVGQAIGGEVGSAISTIGSFTATGAMFGPWGAAVGAAIGVAVVAIRAMQHDWGEDIANQFEHLLPGIEISADLAAEVAKLAEELDDLGREGASGVAVLLSLPKVAQEVGITTENVEQFIRTTRDLFSYLAQDLITTEEAIGVLNQMLPQLAASATDAAGLWSASFRELISLADAFGLEVQAIDALFADQLSNSVSGFNNMVSTAGQTFTTWHDKMLSQIEKELRGNDELLEQFHDMVEEGATLSEIFTHFGVSVGEFLTVLTEGGALSEELWNKFQAGMIKNQAQLEDFQTLLMANFNALIAQGATPFEAIQQLGPGFEQIVMIMEELGLSAHGAFKELFEMYQLMADMPKAFSGMESVNQQLVSLANIGQLNQKTFKALEDQGKRAFRQFTKDGEITNAELQAMAPTLSLLSQLSQQYGFTLDRSTQELIAMAEAQGLLTTEAPADLATVMRDEVIPAIQEMTAGIREFTAAIMGIPANIGTTITTDYVTNGTPPPGGSYSGFSLLGGSRPRHHSITEPTMVTTPEAIVRHGEIVLPEGWSPSAAVSGGGETYNINLTVDGDVWAGAIARKSADGRQISQRAVVPRLTR